MCVIQRFVHHFLKLPTFCLHNNHIPSTLCLQNESRRNQPQQQSKNGNLLQQNNPRRNQGQEIIFPWFVSVLEVLNCPAAFSRRFWQISPLMVKVSAVAQKRNAPFSSSSGERTAIDRGRQRSRHSSRRRRRLLVPQIGRRHPQGGLQR